MFILHSLCVVNSRQAAEPAFWDAPYNGGRVAEFNGQVCEVDHLLWVSDFGWLGRGFATDGWRGAGRGFARWAWWGSALLGGGSELCSEEELRLAESVEAVTVLAAAAMMMVRVEVAVLPAWSVAT